MFQARIMRGWLHSPGLAASYLVVSNGPLWRPWMDYLGQYELEGGRADYPYAIFGHDWLAGPPAEWRDQHLDEELWVDRHPPCSCARTGPPAEPRVTPPPHPLRVRACGRCRRT
ncbi:hypothetical protein [Nonomuraea zeae]|uniref:Uncharacterized protein n=1 Tax=Nonomuraea zeae TaxID=1642303 RepID=A0A5S4H041_9ACTN|nr:hypothetical protein [Nonomuraea zeae]TMR38598.1 hypothetical protein ETD85_04515 [Nonomuraea zeae]